MDHPSGNPFKSTQARAKLRKVGKQVSKVSKVFRVLDHFHLFPNLPLELRQKIWKSATEPQIITWKQKQALPGMLHTSYESRSAWLLHHNIESWQTTLFDKDTLYVDHHADILFFEGVIPGLRGWTMIPASIDMECKGVLRYSRWLKEVRRLAMPYSMAMEELNVQMPTGHQHAVNPWKKLTAWCPNLEELTIVMGRGAGNNQKRLMGEDDWIEVGTSRVPVEPWSFRWDTPDFRVAGFRATELKQLRDVTLRFVKQK